MLKIAHHGVKFRHGIADGRTCGKHHPLVAGQLVNIAAFQQHIGGFLCISSGKSCYVSHFRIEEQIFERMGFVHIKAVYAQFLKGHDVILASGFQQLFQSDLQPLLRALHALDGKALCAAVFHFFNAFGHFFDLLPDHSFLALHGYGNAFELAVPDDDRIVVAGGNAGAELFAILRLEVLFRCGQNIGGRIQPQKLRCPLLRQVVGNHKHGLVAQSQPLGFHRGGDHFKGLACAHFVCQQRIAAVKNMRHGVQLVFSQMDFRVHAAETDVAAIVFAWTIEIEQLVIASNQRSPPIRVFPNPFGESVLDGLLLLLCKRRFLGVENALLLAVWTFPCIVNAHVP